MQVRDDIARLLSGDIPPPTLEERVRETFSQSKNDQVSEALRKYATELRYSTGVEAAPVYGRLHSETKRKWHGAGEPPPGWELRPATKVQEITKDPEGNVPIGIEVNGKVTLIDQDEKLQALVVGIDKTRADLLEELKQNVGELEPRERIEPGAKSTPEGYLSNLRSKWGNDNVIEVGDDDEHVLVFKPEGMVFADKKGFGEGSLLGDIADVSGDVGEMGVDAIAQILTNVAAKRSPIPIPPTLTAAVTGAAANIARQGVSKALPGEDYPGATPMEELAGRGGQLLVSGAGGAGGEIVGKGLGAAARRLPIGKRARLASGVAESEVDVLAERAGVESFLAEARAAEKEISELAGEQASLSVGQATGVGRAIEAERGLLAKTPDPLIRAQKKRLEIGAKATDVLVEHVQRMPTSLGDEAVGSGLVDAIKNSSKAIRNLRTKLATPFYKDVERATGINLFPEAPIKTMADQLNTEFGRFGGVGTKIRKTLRFLGNNSNENGMLAIDALNQERQFWSRIAVGNGTVSSEMSREANKMFAARMLSAIDESMDHATQNFESWITRTAAEGPSFKSSQTAQAAIDNLRRANGIWSTYSKQLKQFTDPKELASRILKLPHEKIPDFLLTASRKEVRGLFKVLDRLPLGRQEVARTKAKMLADVFQRGGKMVGEENPFGLKLVTGQIEPLPMVKALKKNWKQLDNIFADQPEVKNKLRAITAWFDRISSGPKVGAVQAAPSWADKAILNEVQKRGIHDLVAGIPVSVAKRVSKRIANASGLSISDKELATLLTAGGREGVDAFYELMASQTRPGRQIVTERGARALIHMLAILEREDIIAETEELFNE